MFFVLRKYNIRLIPNKCVFRVSLKKFFMYMINQRGIKVNPNKIQDVLKMAYPKTVKDVQRLTRRPGALSRFILRMTQKNLPFFKILRGIKQFKQSPEYEKIFIELKEYITKSSLLSKPKFEKELFLYFTIFVTIVSATFVQEESGIQLLMYYVNHSMIFVKTMDLDIKKLVIPQYLMILSLFANNTISS